ncbi:MAG: acyl-CoA desaturase [Micavibrio sp.]|nr:MAG: acyl-CoA desaturase [Micavibrio sp.]
MNTDRKSSSANKAEAIDHTAYTRIFIPNVIYFHLMQFGGFFAALYFLALSQVSPLWWGLAAFSYFCSSCLGMAITFHRVLAHRTFALPKPLEYLFSWFGMMGGTGSTIAWIALHRRHHAHPDTDEDPHSPERFGWKMLFSGFEMKLDWQRVRDLLRDPFHIFLNRYYIILIASWATLLFLIHPLAFFFGFLIPASMQITISNLSTILGHGHGYRNFETKDHSTNNVLIAALTWGEGWHNNHHADPRNWRLGLKWWELDPAAWIITAMTKLGIVKQESFLQH